jgi:hypothetical protein
MGTMSLTLRICCSFVAAVVGWAVGNAVTSSLILLQSPFFPWTGWALATGVVCAVAWGLAGVPLAISGATFAPGWPMLRAMLFAGLIACAVMAALFGPDAMRSSGARTIAYIVCGQAFVTATVAMLVYGLLAGRPSSDRRP